MSDCVDIEQKDEIFDWQAKQNELPGSDRSSIGGDVFTSNKGTNLPIARIKKIMKEGEHPGMIAADAPVLLAKACEMLIKDLTLQSWDCTLTTRRCTLQRQDVAAAIFKNSIYNFMLDIFTPEELYPKMEPKAGSVLHFNGMNHVNDGRTCPMINSLNKPRDGYAPGALAIGQGHGAIGHHNIYHTGAQRFMMNPAAHGRIIGSPSQQMLQCHGVPTVNTMMRYSKSVPLGGHILQNGHVSKVPMQMLQHCAESHPIIQGTMAFTEGDLQSSVQPNQVLQSQMSYTQHYGTSDEHSSPRTYQQPF
ncbi:Nuclear transcription factor Y subunit C-3 [Babesia sp. Xinjiang]|uniref:Nuclear transcription factor Y subunit C-3 n=1 Tax=Babesia sp. Xinjiang TaxID=462227 RepID=UPI000A25CB0F|nr:Nuclear transcription factor Y subunit C-3 [Babesia sp. Xinjiang]ORM42328.1 Nuclear transcription factor Y subunit C-3 [Babesia sp. Xinjiang]